MRPRLNGTAGDSRDQSSDGIGRRSALACAAHRFLHNIADAGKNRLLGRRSGEIRLRPKKRVPYFLIFSQRLIGALNCQSKAAVGAAQQEYSARLGVAVPFEANHDAIANAGLRSQRFFQILGVNIHTGRSDDDIFSPALEIQVASLVLLRDISRSEPSVGFGYRQYLPILPVSGRDVFSTHEDFAIFIYAHFHPRKHLADGTLGGTEGMIQADERRGFRHAVSLDYGVAQPVPKRLGLLGKCGATRDEGPEFPAES